MSLRLKATLATAGLLLAFAHVLLTVVDGNTALAEPGSQMLSQLAIALVATVGVAYMLFGVMTAGLRRLVRISTLAQRKGSNIRLAVRGYDEIARLTEALNQISEDLSVTKRQLNDTRQQCESLTETVEQAERKHYQLISNVGCPVLYIAANGEIIEFNDSTLSKFWDTPSTIWWAAESKKCSTTSTAGSMISYLS